MSRLRRTIPADPSTFAPTGATAYLMILSAVRAQKGLIHGRLDDERGAHCAIGGYFHVNNKIALSESLIDEVAAVNDSVPGKTPWQRKMHVTRWLKFRLQQLGYKA